MLNTYADEIEQGRLGEDTIRVLLIEDNDTDAFLVKRMLCGTRSEAFYITNVARMADALRALDEAFFDIVLLDLNLLDIDGVASVSALNAEYPNIPIIVYSGTHDLLLQEGAMMCGAKHYLMKGHENATLLRSMIHRTLAYEEI